jgi:hypothetical protein
MANTLSNSERYRHHAIVVPHLSAVHLPYIRAAIEWAASVLFITPVLR